MTNILYIPVIVLLYLLSKSAHSKYGHYIEEKVKQKIFDRFEDNNSKVVSIENAEYDKESPFSKDKFKFVQDIHFKSNFNRVFYFKITLIKEKEVLIKWAHIEFFFSHIIFFVIKD